ncbi:hypothetical protein [Nocardia sp. alder85J]|uniref:hypothetical protein n=1 Tax=Nocardia sp. alder85J TaxID=2862949 RepID=UPI001CD74E12|nr:hypothetical protein [Nocardia sp. alder85J]MCX4097005.1 hypothetical protein [Nocardia sp. alder85J]
MTGPTHVSAVPDTARMFIGTTIHGETSPTPLHAVPADTYRPCDHPACHTPHGRDEDFHTVTVHTLTEPALPWWTTVEIHLCETGHGELVARPTAATLRPLTPSTTHAGIGLRAFEVVSADGQHRSVLGTVATGNGYECQNCRRPWAMTWYELPNDARAAIPEWFTNWLSLEIHWCDGCGHGQIRHHSYTCLAEPAPPAVDR